jgi:hypothetical protein
MKKLNLAFDAVGRFAASLAVFLLLALVACGPGAAGGGATPEASSLVIMGERANEEFGAVEHFPACMAVSVAPTAILTAAHCQPVGDTFLIVDAATWQRTASGVAFADLAFDAGEVRTLVPRQPLLNWAVPGEARDGPASFVVVRGSTIGQLPTVLNGDHMSGMVEHGDSGAGVFQGGLLVGIVQTCSSSNDTDCDLDGGRFVGMP